MERSVALKKLTKLLGKDFGYRVDNKAPSPEERAVAKAELPAANEERNALEKKRNERRREILAADAEYQSLCAAHETAQKRAANLMGKIHSPKITVGRNNGMFFMVKAEGDSWEEIISIVERKAREVAR